MSVSLVPNNYFQSCQNMLARPGEGCSPQMACKVTLLVAAILTGLLAALGGTHVITMHVGVTAVLGTISGMILLPLLLSCICRREEIFPPAVYPNNLKNWEFDKEAPQNFCPERATIAERQGASEGENFEAKLTQSKTNSSSCLGIYISPVSLPSPEVIQPDSVSKTREHYRKIIIEVKELAPRSRCNNYYKDRMEPYHQILNGLYLGNAIGFTRCTTFNAKYDNPRNAWLKKRCNPTTYPLITSNPDKIKTIISACPLSVLHYCPLLSEKNSIFIESYDPSNGNLKQFFKAQFEQQGIIWLPVGLALEDDLTAWEQLVYNCTYPHSELAQMEKPSSIEEEEKKKLAQAIPIEDQFTPIFEEMDKAVFEGEKTLVHCQAGVSRSSTVVASYLINRFGVTAEQAIAFLRSKRACVNPEFILRLKRYSLELRSARGEIPIDALKVELNLLAFEIREYYMRKCEQLVKELKKLELTKKNSAPRVLLAASTSSSTPPQVNNV